MRVVFEPLGLMLPFSWKLMPPSQRVTAVGLMEMDFGEATTVTVQVAFLPLVVLTVILALPFLTAFTTPLPFTVAYLFLLVDQVTSGLLPWGTLAMRGKVSPTPSLMEVLLRVTLLGAVQTVTTQLFSTGEVMPLYVVAVMIAVPSALPVTRPALSTVATEGSED